MKRVRRRILGVLMNAAIVLSLLLCVATIALWLRSYRAGDNFGWGGARAQFRASISRGYVCFDAETVRPPSQYIYPRGWWHKTVEPRDSFPWAGFPDGFQFAGLRVTWRQDSESPHRHNYHRLILPMWPLALGWGILPAWRVRRSRKNRRRHAVEGAVCPACGYDLRETPERCPECGRDVA